MADTTQWSEDKIGGEAPLLNAVTVSEGRRHRWGFVDALQGWHSHVSKLTADSELPPTSPGLWGPHDLVAALVFRNALESGLERVPQGLLRVASAALDDVDRAYLDWTEPDDCGCVGRVDTDVASETGWWWQRVPRTGLVRRELEQFYGHPSRGPRLASS